MGRGVGYSGEAVEEWNSIQGGECVEGAFYELLPSRAGTYSQVETGGIINQVHCYRVLCLTTGLFLVYILYLTDLNCPTQKYSFTYLWSEM